MKIKGLDDLQKKLSNMQDNLEEIEGNHKYRLVDLLNNDFMSAYTDYTSLEKFFEAGDFEINSAEDLDNENLDKFVANNTNFSSWSEMFETASTKYFAKKIGF